MAISDLDVAVGSAERVLVDSSTLIAYQTIHESTHFLATHLLRRIVRDSDPLRGYFSCVSAAEVLIRPIRSGHQEFTFMHLFLTATPNFQVLPIDITVATQAAILRAATGIGLADACIVASGLLAGCEAIISNDGQWRSRLEPLFQQLRWLYLADFV